MPYLIPNPHERVFEARIHHFSCRPIGPRLVESPTGRMVIACAPWPEVQKLLANLGSMNVAAYLLVGSIWPDGTITRCYVGETVDILTRLKRHARDPQKAFVNQAYVIGSLDPNYDKTDVQLLQHHLDKRIESLDRAFVVRGTRPSLPQVDPWRLRRSNLDLEDVRRILPSVGCNILEPGASDPEGFPAANQKANESGDRERREVSWDNPVATTLQHVSRGERRSKSCAKAGQLRPQITPSISRPTLFILNHAGLVAYGYQYDSEFVVLPGSQMRRSAMLSFADDAANMQRRNDLINAQVVAMEPGHDDRWRLTRERNFPSRAIAAKVLMGTNLRNDAWYAVIADNGKP